MSQTLRIHALLILLSTLVLGSCAVSQNPLSGNRRAFGYSWEQEQQLGAEADPQIVAQFGLYQDEQVQQYVRQVGERVLAESHLRRPDTDPAFRIPFTFRVLDSPVINAFALPGGYVYVTRGLMTHLNNEAQLAVVLGHEITHVAGRHASRQAASAQLAQLGLIGGAILGQTIFGGAAGENILNLGSVTAQLLLLRYGREAETESDVNGVEYAALAGYDAAQGAAFFESLERIQQEQGQVLPTWQSSHPDPGDRETNIQRLAAEWQQRGVAMEEVDQDEYLRVIDGMVMGENPRQGFVEGGTFYHPDLQFQFPVPSGFVLQNANTQVAMLDQNQRAILVFTFADASSAQAAASEMASQQGIQVLDSGTDRVGGLSAAFVLGDAQTEQGVIRFLNYFIDFGGRVYQFLGYAGQQNFSAYQDNFLRTIRGFDRVTERRILDVQPVRLDVVTAQQTAPFQNFLPRSLPGYFDLNAEELAILNQTQLNETIPNGYPLKLPRP